MIGQTIEMKKQRLKDSEETASTLEVRGNLEALKASITVHVNGCFIILMNDEGSKVNLGLSV